MKYKIQYRKVYDDGSFDEWKRWKSKVYNKWENAQHALFYLEPAHRNWGFDFEKVKMWKYEFKIVEHIKIEKPL